MLPPSLSESAVHPRRQDRRPGQRDAGRGEEPVAARGAGGPSSQALVDASDALTRRSCLRSEATAAHRGVRGSRCHEEDREALLLVTFAVLEAMKMENEPVAERSGTVLHKAAGRASTLTTSSSSWRRGGGRSDLDGRRNGCLIRGRRTRGFCTAIRAMQRSVRTVRIYRNVHGELALTRAAITPKGD